MSQQGTVKGYGFVRGKLGEDGVVEKCDMYNYPHICTPRWCSPPPEGHPPVCPKCGATQRTSYLSACWTDTHGWHGGMKVPPVAMIPNAAAAFAEGDRMPEEKVSQSWRTDMLGNDASAADAGTRKPTEIYPMPTLQDVLTNACQLLDSIKMEWEPEGCWSNWDQQVREAMTRELRKTYADRAAPPAPQEAAPRKTRDQIERETPILEGLYCPRCDAYHSAGWHKDEVNVASWTTAPDSAMRVARQIRREVYGPYLATESAEDRIAAEEKLAALIREAGSEPE